ncbi:MAG TPA: amylo-alpha-1,6-glucosidase [Candidatus Eisenbacteria bacterium]|jgi:predicted glycogen debranching enzyme
MDAIRFGRDRLSRPGDADRLEWLVTNGIGGYASGTVSGALTRRYHGLLVAALEPPLGRTLLLAKLGERLLHDGEWVDLDANRWASGAVTPGPPIHLESFRLEGTVPVWTWALGDLRLEKRVWMEHGENTTYVQYRVAASSSTARLALRALTSHRDAHGLTAHGEHSATIEPAAGGLKIVAFEGASPLWLFAPGAEVRPANDWYRGFALALESERGLDAIEDHLCAAEIEARLEPGEALTLVASTRHGAGLPARGTLSLAGALSRRRAHDRSLLAAWSTAGGALARSAPAWVQQLVLAADAFVVERAGEAEPNGRTVIAGYPWFGDWGRDALIALPGLALVVGRPEVARAVIATFARHVDQGLVPNHFPESGGGPDYVSVDAALWLFQAVRAYVEATGDDAFLAELYPTLEDIGAWFERGTRYGVRVDPRDGLLDAGEPGLALTWMDARVDGEPVTPRQGKAVEVNALWHGALRAMAGFARRLKRPGEAYEEMAARVARSFERFWNQETGCLDDVLDGPSGRDAALRPNQIFAVSLPESPLPASRRRAVLEACGRRLLTSHGLRSLSPGDPRYRGVYLGDPRDRDRAYHQGTAWTWLLPHYALAHFRVHGSREEALALLEPLGDLLASFGVGYLPEIADGDPPHAPRGCIAQAWSVGETLRAWHEIAGAKRAAKGASGARTRATAKATEAAIALASGGIADSPG